MEHILKLEPVFIKKIWGGSTLADKYQYQLPNQSIGEAMCVSGKKECDCKITNTEFAGLTLSQVFKENPDLFGNLETNEFPLQVKIVDATDDISIQVHPDNQYGMKYENQQGKYESFYVIEAKNDAKLVIGHHATYRKEFIDLLEADQYEELFSYIPVKKGDFYPIPTGTLHSIGKGILVYEVSQASDLTYRLYDYHRKDEDGKERELHIDKCLDILSIPSTKINNKVVTESYAHGTRTEYTSNPFYTMKGYFIDGRMIYEHSEPFIILSILEGFGQINHMDVKAGEHFIVCADTKRLHFSGIFKVMMTTL